MIEVLGCLKATSRRWFVAGEVCWPCAAAAFLCSKQPPVVRRGSKKVRLVETRAAWPFQIEGAAGWCRDRAQVAIGAVFPVAAAVAVGPRCPPATALEGLALWLGRAVERSVRACSDSRPCGDLDTRLLGVCRSLCALMGEHRRPPGGVSALRSGSVSLERGVRGVANDRPIY